MKKCSNENCIPTCEFCIYYRLHLVDKAQKSDGWCAIHRKEKAPYEMCEDFYCHIAYREDNWS